jgi:hypothetical protein
MRRRASAARASAWLAALLALGACRKPAARAHPVALVQDFEREVSLKRWPREAKGEARLSRAWAADGARSLEVGPGVMASFQDLLVSDWSGYARLRFTVHNPGPRTEHFGVEIQDRHAAFDDRHQRNLGAPPGDTVVAIDFSSGLWRGEENRPYRGAVKTPIDVSRITRLSFANHGAGTLFFDRLEVVEVPPLRTPGGFAFDLGPRGQQVMSETTGVFEDTRYTPERGHGFLGPLPPVTRPLSYPTPLLGDGLPLGEGLRVDLPGGAYLGWIAFERGGFSEDEQSGYERAALLVNGAVAAAHAFSRGGPHFLFEDTELTDLAQIEERLVRPAHAITRFRFEARPGGNVFSLAVEGATGLPLRVAGLLLAPDTPAGAAFLDAHEALGREALALAYPPQDRARRGPPPGRELVAEPLALGADLFPRSTPAHPEGQELPELDAVAGQVAAVQLALYARRPLDVQVEAALDGLPSPIVSHGRYLPTRPLGNGPVWLHVDHYRPEPRFAVRPELARAVLVAWRVPADAAPGLHTGAVTFTAGDVTLRVPVRVRVHAVALPPLPIPVGLLMNALPFPPSAVGEDRWWELQAALLDAQASAGLNCVTGGAALAFDRQRGLSGERPLFYLALARTRGPLLAAVSYGGFFPALRLDELAARALAASLDALTRARELPPFYLSTFDEPGTEAELAEAYAAAAPLAGAGLRTFGFLTARKDDRRVDRLLGVTHAPAVNGHAPADLRALAARGAHPWVYNNGLDRWAMGLHLWRNLQAGAEGRLEWIGLITQGFAFDDLDAREPATSAFVVHDRLGPMPTPRWLSAREGLLDLRIRLALEKALPPGDPALAGWTMDGYGQDRDRWTDAALAAARASMLARLGARP